jgi:hypothetical protein
MGNQYKDVCFFTKVKKDTIIYCPLFQAVDLGIVFLKSNEGALRH